MMRAGGLRGEVLPPSLIDSNGYSSGANDFLSARKTFPIISMALGGGVRCAAAAMSKCVPSFDKSAL
jgi:hypothetical protein